MGIVLLKSEEKGYFEIWRYNTLVVNISNDKYKAEDCIKLIQSDVVNKILDTPGNRLLMESQLTIEVGEYSILGGILFIQVFCYKDIPMFPVVYSIKAKDSILKDLLNYLNFLNGTEIRNNQSIDITGCQIFNDWRDVDFYYKDNIDKRGYGFLWFCNSVNQWIRILHNTTDLSRYMEYRVLNMASQFKDIKDKEDLSIVFAVKKSNQHVFCPTGKENLGEDVELVRESSLNCICICSYKLTPFVSYIYLLDKN